MPEEDYWLEVQPKENVCQDVVLVKTKFVVAIHGDAAETKIHLLSGKVVEVDQGVAVVASMFGIDIARGEK